MIGMHSHSIEILLRYFCDRYKYVKRTVLTLGDEGPCIENASELSDFTCREVSRPNSKTAPQPRCSLHLPRQLKKAENVA